MKMIMFLIVLLLLPLLLSSKALTITNTLSLLQVSPSSLVDNDNSHGHNYKSAAELKQDAKAIATKELLSKISNATTTDEVFILAEEIPAILRSVDKVMRIVIASGNDALLASHCIQRLASITSKSGSSSHNTWIGERRFEQLTECVEIKADRLKTADLTRYLWGLTVLGINETDMIDFVFDEFTNRSKNLMKIENNDTNGLGLGTLSLDKDKIEDVATMLWSIGCVKDTFGWTNTSLAETLCSMLRTYCSETLRPDDTLATHATLGFSKRLFIRALWSLAVHNLLDQSLFSSGLAVIHAAHDDLSSTNVIILLWSCAQVKLLNKVSNEDKKRLMYVLEKLQNNFQLNHVNLADISLCADAMDSLYCTLVDRLENSSSSIVEKELNHQLATLLKDTVALMASKLTPSFPHLSLSAVCSVMRAASRTCTCTPDLWNQALQRLENKNLTISKYDALTLLEAIACMPETTNPLVPVPESASSIVSNEDEALTIKISGLLKMPRPGRRSQSARWFFIAGKLSSIISSRQDEIKTRHMIDAFWAINSMGFAHRNLMLSIQERLKNKSPKEIMLELTPRALSRLVRSISNIDHGLLSKPASYPSPIITKLDRVWIENVMTAAVSSINDIEPVIRRVATIISIACMYPSTTFQQTISLSMTLEDMKMIPDRLLIEFMWASKILPIGTINPSIVLAILGELDTRVMNLRKMNEEGEIDHSKNDLHFFIQAFKLDTPNHLIQNSQESVLMLCSQLLVKKWIHDEEIGKAKTFGITAVSSMAICASGLCELIESCLENKWYKNEVIEICDKFMKKSEELRKERKSSQENGEHSEEYYQLGRLEQLIYIYQNMINLPKHDRRPVFRQFFSKILHLI